jgi:hypothetical protein
MNNTKTYNPNLRLSPHFRLGEFTRSITAERLGISNEPNFDQLLFEHSARLRSRWLHISCRWDSTRNRHMSIFNYQAR